MTYCSLSDILQCQTGNAGCEQLCIELIPGYKCDCEPGYLLNSNGSTCSGEQLHLLNLAAWQCCSVLPPFITVTVYRYVAVLQYTVTIQSAKYQYIVSVCIVGSGISSVQIRSHDST